MGEDFGGCGVVPPAATVGFFDQIGSEDEINSQASRLLILACLRRF